MMNTELARFATGSDEFVEMGNREDIQTFPRFTIDSGVRVLGLSRRALGLYAHLGTGTLPTGSNMTPGSLVWITDPMTGIGNIHVWDGTGWKMVTRQP